MFCALDASSVCAIFAVVLDRRRCIVATSCQSLLVELTLVMMDLSDDDVHVPYDRSDGGGSLDSDDGLAW